MNYHLLYIFFKKHTKQLLCYTRVVVLTKIPVKVKICYRGENENYIYPLGSICLNKISQND